MQFARANLILGRCEMNKKVVFPLIIVCSLNLLACGSKPTEPSNVPTAPLSGTAGPIDGSYSAQSYACNNGVNVLSSIALKIKFSGVGAVFSVTNGNQLETYSYTVAYNSGKATLTPSGSVSCVNTQT